MLPVRNPSPLLLSELEKELSDKDMFEYVFIENVCPKDPRKKYEYFNVLKNGLFVRTAKLTYSHVNSVGNLNFI